MCVQAWLASPFAKGEVWDVTAADRCLYKASMFTAPVALLCADFIVYVVINISKVYVICFIFQLYMWKSCVFLFVVLISCASFDLIGVHPERLVVFGNYWIWKRKTKAPQPKSCRSRKQNGHTFEGAVCEDLRWNICWFCFCCIVNSNLFVTLLASTYWFPGYCRGWRFQEDSQTLMSWELVEAKVRSEEELTLPNVLVTKCHMSCVFCLRTYLMPESQRSSE